MRCHLQADWQWLQKTPRSLSDPHTFIRPHCLQSFLLTRFSRLSSSGAFSFTCLSTLSTTGEVWSFCDHEKLTELKKIQNMASDRDEECLTCFDLFGGGQIYAGTRVLHSVDTGMVGSCNPCLWCSVLFTIVDILPLCRLMILFPNTKRFFASNWKKAWLDQAKSATTLIETASPNFHFMSGTWQK